MFAFVQSRNRFYLFYYINRIPDRNDKKDRTDTQTALTVYGNLARIYRIYGRYDRALALYETLLARYPDYHTSLNYNVACLYALLGQPEEAASHLAVALRIDPDLARHAERDPDFDPVRQDPVFRACLAK